MAYQFESTLDKPNRSIGSNKNWQILQKKRDTKYRKGTTKVSVGMNRKDITRPKFVDEIDTPEVVTLVMARVAEVERLLHAGRLLEAGELATALLDDRKIGDMEVRKRLSDIEDRHNPDFEKKRVKKVYKKRSKSNKAITYDFGFKPRPPTNLAENYG